MRVLLRNIMRICDVIAERYVAPRSTLSISMFPKARLLWSDESYDARGLSAGYHAWQPTLLMRR